MSDFDDYSVNGMSTTIEWNPFSSSSVVCNSSDWQPSFFVNQDSLLNVKVKGEIYISSATDDDDFVGFVFGYKSPNPSTNGNDNHFYLFDWRKNTQYAPEEYGGFLAQEGFCLTKAQGTEYSSPFPTFRRFWGHYEGQNFRILDDLYGDSYGWEYNTTYHFELIYTSKKIIISINGEEIFNIDGCHQPGLFGLYSFNQNGAIYRNIVIEQYYDIQMNGGVNSICEDEIVEFMVIDTTCSSIPESLTSWEWSFGDNSHNSNLISPSHTFYTPGEYEVALTLTDLNSCTDTVYQLIKVWQNATVTEDPDNQDCLTGDTIRFSIESVNAKFFHWYYQTEGMTSWEKLKNDIYYSGVKTKQLTISNVRPEMNQMKLRCSIEGLCGPIVSSDDAKINIIETPIRSRISTLKPSVCSYELIDMSVNLTELILVNFANMRIIYDTNMFKVINYSSNLHDVSITITTAEDYINIVYETDEPLNLIDAVIASIQLETVNQINDVKVFDWDEDETYFINFNEDTISSFLYNSTVLIHKPSASGLDPSFDICYDSELKIDTSLFSNYLWSTGETTPIINVKTDGNYWVELVDNNDCLVKDSFNINVIKLPIQPEKVILDKEFYCLSEDEISFEVEGGEGDFLQLDYAGNTMIDSSSSNYTYIIENPESDFLIQAFWKNSCGSSSSVFKNVFVKPMVEPSVSILVDDDEFDLGELVTFKANASGIDDNPYYIWRVDNVTLQAGYEDIFKTNELKNKQIVSLGLYSDAFCILNSNYAEAKKQIKITGIDDLFIPNLVVIGGSTNYNSFKVVFRDNEIYHYKLSIYDLSGRLIYHTRNLHDFWYAENVNSGSLEIYTYRIQYSKEYKPVGDELKIVTGKFLLKK